MKALKIEVREWNGKEKHVVVRGTEEFFYVGVFAEVEVKPYGVIKLWHNGEYIGEISFVPGLTKVEYKTVEKEVKA